MVKISQAKVKVAGINQVCLVVKDVQKTVEAYWNILGIGPWDVYSWEAPLLYDYKYHGKPAQARAKLALTQVGEVQFELAEHIEGDSIYGDFLKEHGEGLHHLNYLVDDVDKTAEILAKQGFPSIQSARFGDTGAYNYIYIEPLHTIWEVVHMPTDMGEEPMRYPDAMQGSPAKVKVAGINQVCLVVKDVQKTVEAYWNILGIGPWDVYSWETPLLYDYKYHGKPAQARAKLALTQVGEVQFELAEHIEGGSIYGDFLKEHGEGLHHLNYLVDDVDETAEILAKQGSPSIQSARFGDTGAYNYIYIEPLRTIWEVVHMPTDMGVEPMRYPQ